MEPGSCLRADVTVGDNLTWFADERYSTGTRLPAEAFGANVEFNVLYLEGKSLIPGAEASGVTGTVVSPSDNGFETSGPEHVISSLWRGHPLVAIGAEEEDITEEGERLIGNHREVGDGRLKENQRLYPLERSLCHS